MNYIKNPLSNDVERESGLEALFIMKRNMVKRHLWVCKRGSENEMAAK
mgnify:CR=1